MTAASGTAAIKNAEQHSSYPVGYCLKFVRAEAWKIGSLYGSAIDAWNGAKYRHPNDRTPPVGAPCFYRGGNYGHVVTAQRKPQDKRMRSTDCTSSGQVSNADIAWVENHWGYTYLGWTEDLNGVRLPIGEEEDMPISEDDLSAIAARINRVLGDYNSQGEPTQGNDSEYANNRLRQIENVVRDIQQRVKQLES